MCIKIGHLTICVLIMCFEVVIDIWYQTLIIRPNYFAIMYVYTRLRPVSLPDARNFRGRGV